MRKNKNIKTALALALGSLATLSYTQSASAVECASCVQVTLEESKAIQGMIATMNAEVSATVATGTSQMLSAMGSATTSNTAMQASLTQQVTDAAADQSMLDRVNRLKDAAPQIACNSISTAVAPKGGGGGAGGTRQAAPGRATATYVDSFESGNGKKSAPPDAATQRYNVGKGSCETFADPNSDRGRLCAAMGVRPGGGAGYADADILAMTLIDGPQPNAAKPVRNRTTSADTSSAEYLAQSGIVHSLTTSSPVPTPDSAMLARPEAKIFQGLRTSYVAAQSLAAYPIDSYAQSRIADPATAPAVAAIAKDYPAFIAKYPEAANAGQNGVSALTLQDLEVEKRIGNGEWIAELNAGRLMSADARQQELVLMNAQLLRLVNQLVNENKQTNMLLGKLLSTQLDAVYRPELERIISRVADTTAVTR